MAKTAGCVSAALLVALIAAIGPPGATGAQGPAGGDGTFSFNSTQASASVRRGHTVTLSFELANETTAPVGRSILAVWWPLKLDLRGRTSTQVPALRAGQSRTVPLKLRVGRRAVLGKQVLTANLKVGGRNISRTVAIVVQP